MYRTADAAALAAKAVAEIEATLGFHYDPAKLAERIGAGLDVGHLYYMGDGRRVRWDGGATWTAINKDGAVGKSIDLPEDKNSQMLDRALIQAAEAASRKPTVVGSL